MTTRQVAKLEKDKADLRARIARQFRLLIPDLVWQEADRQAYVTEALRGEADEESLVKFIQTEVAVLRRQLGYRRSGRRLASSIEQLYDEYTRVRWEASGEEEADEPPADFDIEKRNGKDVIVLYARPWVPPAVIARLYAFARKSYPKDVYGPHLKSLLLFLYVKDRRMEKESWVETMEQWNEMAEFLELSNTYNNVRNFQRDYTRVKKQLGGRWLST